MYPSILDTCVTTCPIYPYPYPYYRPHTPRMSPQKPSIGHRPFLYPIHTAPTLCRRASFSFDRGNCAYPVHARSGMPTKQRMPPSPSPSLKPRACRSADRHTPAPAPYAFFAFALAPTRYMQIGIPISATAPNAACDSRTAVKSPSFASLLAHGFQKAETPKPAASKRLEKRPVADLPPTCTIQGGGERKGVEVGEETRGRLAPDLYNARGGGSGWRGRICAIRGGLDWGRGRDLYNTGGG